MDKKEFNKQLEQNKKIAKNIGVGFLVLLGLFIPLVIYVSFTKKPEVLKAKQEVQPVQSTPTSMLTTEKYNFSVENTIVKKVNKKYRYFFSVKNDDAKDFSGTATITLFNSKNTRLAEQTFTANVQKSGTASIVYLEASTSPEGEFGISSYKYSILNTQKQDVSKGVGKITDKIENL